MPQRNGAARLRNSSKKQDKLQEKLTEVLSEHIRTDDSSESDSQRREKQKARLERQVKRLDEFLTQNQPKQGKTKAEIQSNVTDNESGEDANLPRRDSGL